MKVLDRLIEKWFPLGFGTKSPSKTILGVDISSSAIKLIEMEPSREGFNVIAYGVEPLPEGATFDREIVDVAKIAQVLHSVYKKSGARSRNVAVAVSGSSIISNYIDVPSSLTAKQVEARVKLEADTIIPFPLDEINLDFAVVGQNIANKDHVRVQVVACQRDYVDRRKEVVELAGLNPVVVDIESFAFARAYQTLINFTQKKSLENSVLTAKDEIVAIVDIGATQFTFLVVSNQSIIYSVEQPFGGRQLTEDIQRHYNLTWAEAGRAKRKGGLDADYDEAMLNPFKTLLIEHLARSIQVFYSSTDTDKIDKLVLSGGVSKTDGLRDQVAEAMGIPAEVIDLSKSISVSHLPSSARLTADIPAMMLAFGLALAAESQ